MKKSIVNPFLLATTIILVMAVIFLAWKAGYVKRIVETIAPTEIERSYFDNPQYKERISLFDVYSTPQADIVFVGDSITQRCDYDELFGRNDMANRGVGSDTTEGVLNRLDNIVNLQPKKIFLMIGINDLSQGIAQDTISTNFKSILSALREKLPKVSVYVESVLPVSNGAVNNSKIVALNSAIRESAQEFGYEYVDLYASMADGDQLRDDLTEDGVHLTGAGYLVVKGALENYILN